MTKPIEDYTSEELYLLAEKKRKQEIENVRLKVICNVNCSEIAGLVNLAEVYMTKCEDGEWCDPEPAYEALMEFVYGDDVWAYIDGLEK